MTGDVEVGGLALKYLYLFVYLFLYLEAPIRWMVAGTWRRRAGSLELRVRQTMTMLAGREYQVYIVEWHSHSAFRRKYALLTRSLTLPLTHSRTHARTHCHTGARAHTHTRLHNLSR